MQPTQITLPWLKELEEKPIFIEKNKYEQYIILEDGLKFKFIGSYFKTAELWYVVFEDEEKRQHKANKRKGAALELFAALEKVFKQFIENTLPNKFRFMADIDEKSRIRLYDILSKKIEKMGAGFKSKKKKSPAHMIYDFEHWSIIKNN